MQLNKPPESYSGENNIPAPDARDSAVRSGIPDRQPQIRKVLDRISAEEYSLLLTEGTQVKVKKSTVIFEPSETNAWFILDGYATISRDSKYGDEKIIFICGPHEMLNELVLEDGPSSVTAKALSECTLLKLDRQRLLELTGKDIALYLAIFRSLAGKTRKLYRQAGNSIGTYPLEKHLMVKIWRLARDCGHDTEMGRTVDFDISVTMLSNMLGAQRESVSRAMSALKKEQLIIYDKKRLTVPDMKQLHAMYLP